MMDLFAQIYWHEVDQQGDPVFCDAEINQRQLWPPSPSPKPKTYNAIGGDGEGGREEEGLFAQRIIACNPEFVQRQGVHYCATSSLSDTVVLEEELQMWSRRIIPELVAPTRAL